MALPPSSPGHHASTIAPTLRTHGIVTGPGDWSTTTVRGLAAATARMRRSWSGGSGAQSRSMQGRSENSPDSSVGRGRHDRHVGAAGHPDGALPVAPVVVAHGEAPARGPARGPGAR